MSNVGSVAAFFHCFNSLRLKQIPISFFFLHTSFCNSSIALVVIIQGPFSVTSRIDTFQLLVKRSIVAVQGQLFSFEPYQHYLFDNTPSLGDSV